MNYSIHYTDNKTNEDEILRDVGDLKGTSKNPNRM